MLSFFNKDIPFVNQPSFRAIFLLTVTSTAAIFFFIFKPFGFDYWATDIFGNKGRGILLIFLIGLITLSCSWIIQYILLKRKETYKLWYLITALICESIIITIPLTYIYIHKFDLFIKEYIVNLSLVINSLILCYTLSYLILYFFFAQIKRTHPSSNKYITDNNLSIFDETDHFRLSIQINSLIMFESEDNYVKVYYEENNITKKDMIRITMQRIEELSTNLPYVRCHRRYIINRDKIIAIKKEGRLYKVSLKGINESIPVSRSYFSLIKQM